MNNQKQDSKDLRRERSRDLRQNSTNSEKLLWGLLRGRQLSGLKFRRQYPIENYFADFVCMKERLIVEIDGGYHDDTADYDLRRQSRLESLGWNILRLSDEQVEDDIEAIGLLICAHIGIDYEYKKRSARKSGFLN